ncbi:polyketide cyclase [Mycolicibacterium sp. ELW1]|uniref:polyketide cyclase n=1 Tax=Mycobacteriaceae TaxID=1762 RepID=UPI0011ECE830|nr:polyketide cyclase [Mycobacterium sp. ELW1]QEN12425.1 polyketide cyclase [Mycobacterium sp. ELW1]
MTEILIVATTIDAPAVAVFGVLADPNTHQDIDGTGWVREPLDDGRALTEAGQIFRIAMYHDNHPDKHYEMANQVTVLEPGRVIGWAPGGLAEDGSIELGGWTWRYDLEPLGDEQTRVTLTYDWSGATPEIRKNIVFPPFPVSHLDNSLANLGKLATDRG